MDRAALSSTLIASAGYAPETNVLEVELRSGRVYQFFMVPASVFEGLIAAESAGAYFNREIRPRFPFVEV